MNFKRISILTVSCHGLINFSVYALDARFYVPHFSPLNDEKIAIAPSYPIGGVATLTVVVLIAYLIAYGVLTRDNALIYPLRYGLLAAVAVFIYTAGFALMVAMHMPSYFACAILGLLTFSILLFIQGVVFAIWQAYQ